jgi:hypothetical protein
VELFGQTVSFFGLTYSDGGDVYETEAADGLEMNPANEAGTEDCGMETFHDGL